MTTGVVKKYNPDHRLAHLPHSEYLQTVLEIGWFGSFIHLRLSPIFGIRVSLKRLDQVETRSLNVII